MHDERECEWSERTSAFADGEAPPGDLAAVRAHLAGCARCQELLGDTMALSMLAARPRRRSPLRLAVAASVTLAAAAGLVLWVAQRGRGEQPLALAMAQDAAAGWLDAAGGRPVEGRFAAADLEGWRPRALRRAAESRPTPPAALLAALEAQGDLHAAAALHIAAGQLDAADDLLARAAPSAERASDQALVRLLRGDAPAALSLTGEALARRPDLGAARWNHALALRDLGLTVSAAAELERVSEPGWREEATRLAGALRAEVDERRGADARVVAAWRRFVEGGEPPALADVRLVPDLSRRFLYDALRAAPSGTRALELLPAARELDALTGGEALAARVRRAAQRDPGRGALAAAYRDAFLAPPTTLAARHGLALRFARDEDRRLGALLLAGVERSDAPNADFDLFATLAARSGDPWIEAVGVVVRGMALRARSDLARAEELLASELEACEARRGLEVRCDRIASQLAQAYLTSGRPTEAMAGFVDGLRRARRHGDHRGELVALSLAGRTAASSDERAASLLPLALAFADERLVREPASCAARQHRHELAAHGLALQGKIQEASRELWEAGWFLEPGTPEPSCQPRAYTWSMAVAARVASATGDPREIARVKEAIGSYRAERDPAPGDQALLAYLEALVSLRTAPDESRAAMRAAIALAEAARPDEASADEARADAYLTLVVDAARRGAAGEALALLAEQAHAPRPSRCAAGLAAGDAVVAVVAGADGQVRQALSEGRAGVAAVPAELAATLGGCDLVDVFGGPPVRGLAGVLPGHLAWRWRGDPDRGAPPAPAPAPGRRLVVVGVEPPRHLGLQPVAREWHDAPTPGDVVLRGGQATPTRVAREMPDSAWIELHTHGLFDRSVSEASFLVLAPEADGRFALTPRDVRALALARAPVVVLGACHSARQAPLAHTAGGLPDAFLSAGARAVLAAPGSIPDVEAQEVFGALRRRIEAGAPPAVALRDERAARAAPWLDGLVLFERGGP